jgi:hypothetical protein
MHYLLPTYFWYRALFIESYSVALLLADIEVEAPNLGHPLKQHS